MFVCVCVCVCVCARVRAKTRLMSLYSCSVWRENINKTCFLFSSWSTWKSNQPSGTRSLGSCRCYTSVTRPTSWASMGLSTAMEKSASAWSIWYLIFLICNGCRCVSTTFTLGASSVCFLVSFHVQPPFIHKDQFCWLFLMLSIFPLHCWL